MAQPADTLEVLRKRADDLFAALRRDADRETLQLLVPFMARLIEP